MTPEEIKLLSSAIAERLMFLQKPVLSLDEACRFTNLAKSSIYKLTSARVIPHYKNGKAIYFKRAELEQWLTSTRITPISEVKDNLDSYLSRKGIG